MEHKMAYTMEIETEDGMQSEYMQRMLLDDTAQSSTPGGTDNDLASKDPFEDGTPESSKTGATRLARNDLLAILHEDHEPSLAMVDTPSWAEMVEDEPPLTQPSPRTPDLESHGAKLDDLDPSHNKPSWADMVDDELPLIQASPKAPDPKPNDPELESLVRFDDKPSWVVETADDEELTRPPPSLQRPKIDLYDLDASDDEASWLDMADEDEPPQSPPSPKLRNLEHSDPDPLSEELLGEPIFPDSIEISGDVTAQQPQDPPESQDVTKRKYRRMPQPWKLTPLEPPVCAPPIYRYRIESYMPAQPSLLSFEVKPEDVVERPESPDAEDGVHLSHDVVGDIVQRPPIEVAIDGLLPEPLERSTRTYWIDVDAWIDDEDRFIEMIYQKVGFLPD